MAKKTIMEYYYSNIINWEKVEIGGGMVYHNLLFRYSQKYGYRLLTIVETLNKEGKRIYEVGEKTFDNFFDATIEAQDFGYEVIRGIISRWNVHQKKK